MYPQQHMTITDESQADVVMAVLSGETVGRCAYRDCEHWARRPGAPGYFYCRCHWESDGMGTKPYTNWDFIEFNCDGSRVSK